MASISRLKLRYEVEGQTGAFLTGKTLEITKDGTQLLCDNVNCIKFVDIASGKPASIISTPLQKKKLNRNALDDEEAVDVEDAYKNSKITTSEGEEISTLKVSPDGLKLLVATKTLLLKLYSLPDRTLLQQFRSFHRVAAVCLEWDKSSTLAATGSPDHSIRVWDTKRCCSTHCVRLTGEHIRCVSFHPCLNSHPLLYAGVDNKILVWRLTAGNSEQVHAITDEHYMSVTCLAHDSTGKYLLSSSLDGLVVLWESATMQRLRSVMVQQAVASVVALPHPYTTLQHMHDGVVTVALAGETGHVSIREISKSYEKEVYRSPEPLVLPASDAQRSVAIENLQYNSALDSLVLRSYDQNVLFVRPDTLQCWKILCGDNDDILSTIFVTYDNSKQHRKQKKQKKKDSQENDKKAEESNEDEEEEEQVDSNEMLVVATNCQEIRLYRTSDMSVKLLRGHDSTVMSLASHPSMSDLFASCSQDNSVRVWRTTPDCGAVCVAVATGHSLTVNAITFGLDMMVSGGKDTCLKRWIISEDVLTSIKGKGRPADGCIVGSNTSGIVPKKLLCNSTQAGHDGAVNCVAVSPRDRLVASGSEDKTIKVWSARDLSLVGTLRGHKRYIWSIKFSPVDKLLASASADTTIKIWMLDTLTLVTSLESHNYGVLTVSWINNGLQLFSSAADGSLKVWEVKTRACVSTMSGHAEHRVWAADVKNKGEKIVTAGEDSNIVFWRDVTQDLIQKEAEEKQKLQSAQQALSNLLQAERWQEALALTLKLDQPYNALKVIEGILRKENWQRELTEVVTGLKLHQLGTLVKYAKLWNTRTTTSREAMVIMNLLVMTYLPEELSKIPFWDDSLESFLSFTERHNRRAVSLQQTAGILKFCLGITEMRHGLAGLCLQEQTTTDPSVEFTEVSYSQRKESESAPVQDYDDITMLNKLYPRRRVDEPKEEFSSSSEDEGDSESDDDLTAEEKKEMKKLTVEEHSDDSSYLDIDQENSAAEFSESEKEDQMPKQISRKLKKKSKKVTVEDLDTDYIRERQIHDDEEDPSNKSLSKEYSDEGVGSDMEDDDYENSGNERDNRIDDGERSFNEIIATRGRRDFDGVFRGRGNNDSGNFRGRGGGRGFRGRGDSSALRGRGFRGRDDGGGFRGRGDDFRGRSGSVRGRGDSPGFRGRGDGSRGRGGSFRGRGDSTEFRGRGDSYRGRGGGFRGRGDSPGFRGRGDGSRGRGGSFRGRGDGFRSRGDGFKGRGD